MVALGVSVLLLVLLVVAVGWEAVLGSIGRASLSIYAFAFLAVAACLGLRCLVWHRVLSVVDRRRPYWLVGGVFLTAMFAKYVTPYGQVTSGVGVAAIVSRFYDSEYEEGLAATVGADFLNYLPYYTFGAVGVGYVLLVHSPPLAVDRYLPAAVVAVGVLCLLAVALWSTRGLHRTVALRSLDAVRGLVARVSSDAARHLRRENVRSRFEGFTTTLELISRDRSAMAAALAYAHLGWLGLAAALYVTALAVGVPIPVGIALLCVALSKFGFLVPTPGGVGGVEVALAAALSFLVPMDVAVATAVAILFRFAAYWFTVLLGGVVSIVLTLEDPLPPEAN